MRKRQAIGLAIIVTFVLVTVFGVTTFSGTINQEDTWVAHPLHLVEPAAYVSGYSPAQIRQAYNLPSTGGAGTTIAIIVAYDAPNIQNDLAIFSARYNLPAPSSDNFEIYKMGPNLGTSSDWALETALDVEWAHAIAPEAKIL